MATASAITLIRFAARSIFFFAGMTSCVFAQRANTREDFFLELYSTLCMRDMANVEVLHAQLIKGNLIMLPPDQAKKIMGEEGQAWPIPYKSEFGNFVLALPSKKNTCLIYAHQLDVFAVQEKFISIVSKPPNGFTAKKIVDEQFDNPLQGQKRTLAYTWAKLGAASKFALTLTTVTSEDVMVQAFLSTSTLEGRPYRPGPPFRDGGP